MLNCCKLYYANVIQTFTVAEYLLDRAVHEARTFVNAEVPEDRLDDLRRLLDPELQGTEMGGEMDVFDNSEQVNMELNIEH